MMGTISTVILDLGNVLAFHDNQLLFEQLGRRAGIGGAAIARRFEERALFDVIHRGPHDAAGIHREVCDTTGLDIDFDEFVPLWNGHFRVNEPVLPIVESLVGRVTLVLLSNTNVLHTAYLRPLLPLLERFDHLVLSNEVGLIKPDPAIFRLALTKAGAAPSDALFFDDHPGYVQAAAAAGIRAYVFDGVEGFQARLAEFGLLT